MPTTAEMIAKIEESGICLHPIWGRAFHLATLAEKLPASVRKGGSFYGYTYHSVLPNTALDALEEAYERACEVMAANARRRARKAS